MQGTGRSKGDPRGKESSFSFPVSPVHSKAVPLVKTKLIYCDTLSKTRAPPWFSGLDQQILFSLLSSFLLKGL